MENAQPATTKTYFAVLSLQAADGFAVTHADTYTFPAGTTREQAYIHIRGEASRDYPQLARGLCLNFSLEPNQL